MERGIVSMRVGFVLRSTEIKPLFRDLFDDNYNVFIHMYLLLFEQLN